MIALRHPGHRQYHEALRAAGRCWLTWKGTSPSVMPDGSMFLPLHGGHRNGPCAATARHECRNCHNTVCQNHAVFVHRAGGVHVLCWHCCSIAYPFACDEESGKPRAHIFPRG